MTKEKVSGEVTFRLRPGRGREDSCYAKIWGRSFPGGRREEAVRGSIPGAERRLGSGAECAGQKAGGADASRPRSRTGLSAGAV